MSLVHNSGNSSLRKQLYDITKTPDEIEEVATKDIYNVIKKRRNTTLKGDFGVTVLLMGLCIAQITGFGFNPFIYFRF